MLTIEFPLPTPSLNQWQRMHFHAKKRLRDRYTTLFRVYATQITKAKPREFKRVRIVRHGVRMLDHDNMVGGCKPLMDALERAELIYSDAPQYVAVSYEQQKASATRTKTVVSVY